MPKKQLPNSMENCTKLLKFIKQKHQHLPKTNQTYQITLNIIENHEILHENHGHLPKTEKNIKIVLNTIVKYTQIKNIFLTTNGRNLSR